MIDNTITVYITDNVDNKITILYLEAAWVEALSSGYGLTPYGLIGYGS